MSNRVCFVPTKFENLRSGSITYGFRAYDSYGQTYSNTWESIPDDDLDFLQMIFNDYQDDAIIDEMFAYIISEKDGCEIDGEWFDWDQIKHIVS